MTNSLQSSAEMETKRTQGVSTHAEHWWNKKVPTAKGRAPFVTPVTHDPIKVTEVEQQKGVAIKTEIQSTEHVDIKGKTVPVDDRFLDLVE